MLGLKRKTVKLSKYNPKWNAAFEKEKRPFKKTFVDTIIAIEHIGSTSIPGIVAKPILDMNIGVQSLKIARNMKEKFKQLGYEYRGSKENLKGQELYVKGPESKRTHYAHVAVFGSNFWHRAIFFRNYLRSHKIIATEYAALKIKLAKKYANDRDTYSNSKNEFIQKVLKLAEKERLLK